MEARMLAAGLAVVLSFVSLVSGWTALSGSLRRKRTAIAVQGEGVTLAGLLAWRLRNGVGFLLPLARQLNRLGKIRSFTKEAVDACAVRGVMAEEAAVLSVLIALLGVLFAAGAVMTGGIVAPLALVACVLAILMVVTGSIREKNEEAVKEEVPNALEAMAACFGSGFTLLQTFEQVSKEIPGKLGEVFGKCAHILETGGSAEQALLELRQGAHASELAFVAVALDVQHQNGGTLKQVLDAASDSVNSELALRRSLRVQTAQAKLSARVVVVMPFILIAAFSLASPDFLAPFFSSVAGYALLALAALMQAGGIVLVKRALSVDGVS